MSVVFIVNVRHTKPHKGEGTMNYFRNIMLLSTIIGCYSEATAKNLIFCNKSSTITLNHEKSALRIDNVEKVSGWSELSIIKNLGETHAGNWKEGYSSGIVIGQGGVTPATDLVTSTSNALVTLNSQSLNNLENRIRHNSNAIVYGLTTQDEPLIVTQDVQTYKSLRQLQNGIVIPDNKELILHSPLAVNGSINLGDSGLGTLTLAHDLTLASNAQFSTGGNINGDEYTINFSHNLAIPQAGGGLTFVGNTIIDGNNTTLSFENGAQLLIDSTVSLTLKNMTIVITNPNNILPQANDATLTLENVTLNLTSDIEFNTGKLFIEKNVCIQGNNSFKFQAEKPMIIERFARCFFDTGSNFYYNPGVNDRDLITMHDVTSQIFFNGNTIYSSSTGLRFTKGSLFFDHKNYISGSGTTKEEAIALGNGTVADNIAIIVMPDACIDVISGALDYNNAL
ncbi:MAG: hypothetical protein US69_C0002G0068 [candidate division TM6 bacterium GW2011_GWF2_38_10]|nr:MAG: hypothetical protein US69_C0002G0068 [candidate division TM6 bacterium GW2011_GWF2_38_10]